MPGNILDPISKILRTTPAYLMGWDETDATKVLTPDNILPFPAMKFLSDNHLYYILKHF